MAGGWQLGTGAESGLQGGVELIFLDLYPVSSGVNDLITSKRERHMVPRSVQKDSGVPGLHATLPPL